jgi:hypothetical protein
VNSIRCVVHEKTLDMSMRYTLRIEKGDPSGLEPGCLLLDVPGETFPVASGTTDAFAITDADVFLVNGGSPGETSCAPGASYQADGGVASKLQVGREIATASLTGTVTLDDGTIMRFEANPAQ